MSFAVTMIGRFKIHRASKPRLDVSFDQQALSVMSFSSRWSLGVAPGSDVIILSADFEGRKLQVGGCNDRRYPHRLQFQGSYVEKLPMDTWSTRPAGIVQILRTSKTGVLVMLAPLDPNADLQREFEL